MGESGGSVAELEVFRKSLAERLLRLRASAGLSEERVMVAVNITREELAAYECGEWRPSGLKLLRFAALFGVPLLDLLLGVARDARGSLGSRFDPVAEMLMLYCGVTPEQFAGEGLRTDGVVGEAREACEVLFSKDGDPGRMMTALALRRSYEAGASIRDLALSQGVSFGTARNLLIEAGTVLRGQGGKRGG